jgi:D-sedoheptulose 7-phosphate isomerase
MQVQQSFINHRRVRMNTEQYFELLGHSAKNAPIVSINRALNAIKDAIDRESSIFVCGNGGSALTASHFVTDWAKMRWTNKREKLKAFCLSDNIGMLTAYANDLSYEDVFSEALQNYGSAGDLLIVISGSGNSENVVRALKAARAIGIGSIGISGYSGGKVSELSDISVHFPVNDMQIVEDLHLSFGHIVMKSICA